MTTLQLARNDVRAMTVGDRRLLFHVPTSGLFELDEVGTHLYDLFAELERVGEDDIRRRFDGIAEPAQVVETLRELITLRVIDDGMARPAAAPIEIREFPLSTVVLNVNTGCNLSCTYCYKEDLTTPAKGERMDFDTAARSVDLLLQEAKGRDSVNVVFFGGEPLTNLPLIRRVVEYAGARGRETGQRIDFSLTTNAVLLTEEVVDWLDAHRFGITVSMDGPKPLHDRNRRTVGGKGSYDIVSAKARMLLSRYRSRPVGARVTLTAGVTDVQAIHHHLKDEIGFFEVGFSPVTSGGMTAFNLSGDELAEVFANMKALGREYVEAAKRGENIGFSNMHQLMTDLSEGTTKSLPCGAGLGMLAVDRQGDLHLCHRFTGSTQPTYGNVGDGIARESLAAFLEGMANRTGTGCETCWIRKLCAGGCYHESYARYSDPAHPTYHYCNLMRDWIDFGIRAYAEITVANPTFIERHVAPRRGKK
ncbi:quinohemoprotein amine dehydrogenase maturation protein [Azospirillum thermophilum]|uniref:Quinohemoprotein amine dehydrogenase maturation protein n=1 Tax=Azospirillum thermophilum TaxID=2202148 RepID=A0A2S2CK67_9PROT|nr:quinohemoprotein amine dehydrogenase maturation protein [Azospirillum thermophilum]AWK84881.1 quinohemoprotein amine dehydrogenase maturation protein [Azospirillum thermophilum]